MKPDVRDFFETMTKPAYQDFLQEPLAQHRAKSAIGYANDMAERLFHFLGLETKYPGRQGPGRYRDELAQECSDFALVRDVADGTKHYMINRPNRRVSSASQTSRRELTIDEVDFMVDDIDDWDNNIQIVVMLDDGSQRTLRSILATVIDFWEGKLTALSL